MTCVSRDTEQSAAEARNLSQLQNSRKESRTHSVSDAMGKIEPLPIVNTLRTGDADLRFYITTVQDG